MNGEAGAALTLALAVSEELLAAAKQADLPALERLDAQRLTLLQLLRLERDKLSAGDRSVLRKISELNDRAIGYVENHRRDKGLALDVAALGRRALAAYSTTRQLS